MIKPQFFLVNGDLLKRVWNDNLFIWNMYLKWKVRVSYQHGRKVGSFRRCTSSWYQSIKEDASELRDTLGFWRSSPYVLNSSPHTTYFNDHPVYERRESLQQTEDILLGDHELLKGQGSPLAIFILLRV